jgi:tRNA-2-methylthio-N6-dimethylallyladenosine synthase
MKYYIQTFGCAMNEAESEQIAAWYEARGWQKAKSWRKADEVVINTCSVREAAENRVFGLVNNIRKSKLKSPRIILTGCMIGSGTGKRKRYTLREFKKRFPGVSEFKPWWRWGFEKIKDPKTRQSPPKGQSAPGRKKALVPIMKGCNHFCSYCVVPYSKGKETSFPFEEIVCRVEELAKNGWEHIVLLGQNVNSYGKDFSPKDKKSLFALLLKRIHKIKGIKKISFLTSNPWDFTDELIETLKLPKIDRYLHLPVQSGDDRILKKMNRPYTAQEYLALVKKIKKTVPKIRIGTDIIVGFPGESKAAFDSTLKLCQKVGFEKAYVAAYSVRPGTAAAKLKNNVSHPEKRRRWQILNNLINH